MDSNIKELTSKLSEAEIKCEQCGSTKFELMRTIPEQVALFCANCSSSALLNADELNGTPVITFWTEKDL